MGGMSARSVTIGIPVSDLEAACRWDELVLGKPHDIEPVPGIREFEVTGTWVQLDEGPPNGGHWTLRIGVTDLIAERQRLTRRCGRAYGWKQSILTDCRRPLLEQPAHHA